MKKRHFSSWLCRLFGCHAKHKAKGRFNWAIGQPTNKAQMKGLMLEVTITNKQKIRATLTPVDGDGAPADVDGAPTWTVVSGDATTAVDADGKSAFLISGDKPGDSVILVEADADLGAGVETISDTITLHVEGARAKSLGLSLGTPEPK